ncbi:MAG: unnamed protein product [uncultured Caballeronia sp.]|nr:MAG: unnamed protein product [uncultured Caballeronia sp.]
MGLDSRAEVEAVVESDTEKPFWRIARNERQADMLPSDAKAFDSIERPGDTLDRGGLPSFDP